VILDDVQFARRDYQHRCFLTPAGGHPLPGPWLTLPVRIQAGGLLVEVADLDGAGSERVG
jgi:hypothetical protein